MRTAASISTTTIRNPSAASKASTATSAFSFVPTPIFVRSVQKAYAKYPSMPCLNANYMMLDLTPYFDVPHPRFCKHEFVLSGNRQKKLGVRTLDIAKRLLDFGYHPPTIYFPLSVEECIMIEPTETESKQTLDDFIDTMIAIAKEVEENPDLVKNAPYTTVVSRMDETLAARKPVLNCTCG